MPEVAAAPSTVGAASNRAVHTGCVRKSRARRGRSWHVGKQRQGVARQPAIAGPGPAAVDGRQQGQRHDFTGREGRFRVFWNVTHLLGHGVAQCNNKIWGVLGLAPLGCRLGNLNLSQSVTTCQLVFRCYFSN